MASRPYRGILLENVNGGETGVAVKYIPKTDIEFPSAPDAHLLAVKPSHPVDLSEGYPFRNKSFGFRFCQFWFRIFLHLIVLPVVRIRYCLKVEGRVDRSVLKNGFVTVCNHVCLWDLLIVHCGFPMRHCEFPIWRNNMQAGLKNAYRFMGAIPVPDYQKDGRAATVRFRNALQDVLEEKRWLHVYPEGSAWYYYVPIRPFKKTAFTLAKQYHVPVIPLTISFREPKGIYRWFKKDPCATLHIGSPEYPREDLNKTEAAEELSARCRLAMIRMMGMENEAENDRIASTYRYKR